MTIMNIRPDCGSSGSPVDSGPLVEVCRITVLLAECTTHGRTLNACDEDGRIRLWSLLVITWKYTRIAPREQ